MERIVLGMPRHMNGEVGTAAEEARGFAEKLQADFRMRTPDFWDERLSTRRRIARSAMPAKIARNPRLCRPGAAQMLLQVILISLLANQGAGNRRPLPNESACGGGG